MWWLGDWIRLILHQLPLPRKSLKRGKIILVSTSWWEVSNHIRYGIRYRNDHRIGQDRRSGIRRRRHFFYTLWVGMENGKTWRRPSYPICWRSWRVIRKDFEKKWAV